MSSVRYYTDEHIVRAVIAGLRLRGVDVVTVPKPECSGPAMLSTWPWRIQKVG